MNIRMTVGFSRTTTHVVSS